MRNKMVRRNTQIKSVICIFAAAVLLVGLAGSPCMADFIPMAPDTFLEGKLTFDAGTIIAYIPDEGIGWGSSGTEFYYKVTRPENPSAPLHYYYKFTASVAPNLSHFILQVSEAVEGGLPGFDPYNPTDFDNGPIVAEPPDLFGPASGNPGFPAGKSMWGIKFEDDMPLWIIEFDSYRLPMDGSFYAKGGSTNYAYNSGLEFPDTGAFILVPDTSYVPTPGAVLLGILGLGAVGIKLRKYA